MNDAATIATHTIVVGSQSDCSDIITMLFDNSFSGNTSGIGIRSVIVYDEIFQIISVCFTKNIFRVISIYFQTQEKKIK